MSYFTIRNIVLIQNAIKNFVLSVLANYSFQTQCLVVRTEPDTILNNTAMYCGIQLIVTYTQLYWFKLSYTVHDCFV